MTPAALAYELRQRLRTLGELTACSLTASCVAFCFSRFLVSCTSCSRLVTPCFGFSLRQRDTNACCGPRQTKGCIQGPCAARSKYRRGVRWIDYAFAYRSAAPANSARSAQKSIIAGMAFEQLAGCVKFRLVKVVKKSADTPSACHSATLQPSLILCKHELALDV